jgi:hypothetical protein
LIDIEKNNILRLKCMGITWLNKKAIKKYFSLLLFI